MDRLLLFMFFLFFVCVGAGRRFSFLVSYVVVRAVFPRLVHLVYLLGPRDITDLGAVFCILRSALSLLGFHSTRIRGAPVTCAGFRI